MDHTGTMTRAAGIAAGFALGAGLLGIVMSVATLVGGRLSSDAEGGVGAALLFAMIGFGALAIVGGMSAGVVVGVFERSFFDVSGRGAVGMGLVTGIAVALSASFGMMRVLAVTHSSAGAIFIPSMIAGAIAGVVLIAASAATRAVRALRIHSPP